VSLCNKPLSETDLATIKDAQKKLLDKVAELNEAEKNIREQFPPNSCFQERLGKYLQPLADLIQKCNTALKILQDRLDIASGEFAQCNPAKMLADKMSRKKQLAGNSGSQGSQGSKGRSPEPQTCK